MKEFKSRNGETCTLSPIDGGALAGDVMITTGEDQFPGIVLGGGLSGNVVYPGTIHDPKEPLKPDVIDRPLGGLIIPPWEAENGLMELLEIKRILRDAAKVSLVSEERLKELIQALDERYKWNEEYMKDPEVSADEKFQDVEGVVNGNLTRIREYTENFKAELDDQDTKGTTL